MGLLSLSLEGCDIPVWFGSVTQGSHRLEQALNVKGCLEKALNLP